MPEGKQVKNRVHVDLTPVADGWQEEVDRLSELGAVLVRDVDERPDEAHWLMRDPEGNGFSCVWHREVKRGVAEPSLRAWRGIRWSRMGRSDCSTGSA